MSQLQATNKQSGFINPQTYEQAWQFSEMLANSEMVPKNFKGKPADILIAMQMGSEIGLQPMQSLQNIAVVNGRPTIWGDAVIAICQSSGMLEDITEEVTDDYATVTVKRAGQEPHSVTFSMADAKKAGLAGKAGPWTQYPKRMMKNRARAYALRDKFADVLSGFGITEEEKDRVVDVTPQKPKKTSNAGASALLNRVKKQPTAEAPVIEYYDTSELLATIEQITDVKQVKPIGAEIAAMVNNEAINIRDEDVNELRQALADQKQSIILADEYDNIMKHVKACESLDDVERMRGLIADKQQDFDQGDIKMLNNTLDVVAEEIGAQG